MFEVSKKKILDINFQNVSTNSCLKNILVWRGWVASGRPIKVWDPIISCPWAEYYSRCFCLLYLNSIPLLALLASLYCILRPRLEQSQWLSRFYYLCCTYSWKISGAIKNRWLFFLLFYHVLLQHKSTPLNVSKQKDVLPMTRQVIGSAPTLAENGILVSSTQDRIVLFNVFAAVTAVILKSEHHLVFQCPILKCMNQEERRKEMNFKMTGILRQVLPQIQIQARPGWNQPGEPRFPLPTIELFMQYLMYSKCLTNV